MRERKDGAQTRKQILEAACAVFSEKGYRAAKIADICRIAGTNTASVNYHFGDKESLYVEAWRGAFHRSLDAHPPDGGLPADAPAEERFRGRVLSFLERLKDRNSREFGILEKETANPTGLLTEVFHDCVTPIRQGLRTVVRELLGGGADEEEVDLCEMSVMSQCLNPRVRPRRDAPPGAPSRPAPPPLDMDAAAVADHVVRFSLPGSGRPAPGSKRNGP